jgi:hypothetical protein
MADITNLSGENIMIKVTSGVTVNFGDATHDYRYYRMSVSGNPAATATDVTVNGVRGTWGGIVTAPDSIVVDMPIWSCVVHNGQVYLHGVKSQKTMFGQFSSSSEGLT